MINDNPYKKIKKAFMILTIINIIELLLYIYLKPMLIGKRYEIFQLFHWVFLSIIVVIAIKKFINLYKEIKKETY